MELVLEGRRRRRAPRPELPVSRFAQGEPMEFVLIISLPLLILIIIVALCQLSCRPTTKGQREACAVDKGTSGFFACAYMHKHVLFGVFFTLFFLSFFELGQYTVHYKRNWSQRSNQVRNHTKMYQCH
ncbi:hypothetical protein ABZP36_028983 [Zizania latifolia]